MMEYKNARDSVSIKDVLEVCSKYITSQESLNLINQAYDYIMEKHKDQKRKSGECPELRMEIITFTFFATSRELVFR